MSGQRLGQSIGAKIFIAFLAMSFVTAGLGSYGYFVLRASGRIVVDTYDRPMMSINFARAASVDFLEMQNAALNAALAAPAQRTALEQKIEMLASTFFDDLDVADERSTAPDERAAIADIRQLVGSWLAARRTPAKANVETIGQKILDHFDLLIEYNADHGFVSRRVAVSEISKYTDLAIALTLLGLFLSGSVTVYLVRRIVRPLSAAALVADRIAAGEFETPIPQGGPGETGVLLNSMCVMQKSIASQMAREKARAQSAESRLLDAVEYSGEGVILADRNGVIVVANSELARLFPGIAHEIVRGRPLGFTLALIESQCRPLDSMAQALQNLLQAEHPENFNAGTERQLPDGRWIRIAASGTREGAFILFFSDFSEIKVREESYRVAKQQAEAASAAKSRFLANMSHELRTPLNAVIGFSEILAGELFGALGDLRYREYSSAILESGRNLLNVINSVLEIARSDAGATELSKRTLDLRGVARECAAMFAKQSESAGLRLSVPASGAPLYVDGDEEKLRQVFLNLLSNAIKFSDRGSAVELRIAGDDDDVVVEISDTGIGMLPHEIETALTPFAQIDNRLERRYEGAGLGLPLAKIFTELHGGTLSICSTPGAGTVVTVRLPRDTAPALAGGLTQRTLRMSHA